LKDEYERTQIKEGDITEIEKLKEERKDQKK